VFGDEFADRTWPSPPATGSGPALRVMSREFRDCSPLCRRVNAYVAIARLPAWLTVEPRALACRWARSPAPGAGGLSRNSATAVDHGRAAARDTARRR
jgi:hypothetical protein